MRAASREALAKAQAIFETILAKQHGETDSLNYMPVATELFELSHSLKKNEQISLTLTNPAYEGESKGRLVDAVFADKLSILVRALIRDMAASRWSSVSDLPAAVEYLAIVAVLEQAQSHGRLQQLEHELLQAISVLSVHTDLRQALQDIHATVEARVVLAERVFGQKLLPESVFLVQQGIQADLRKPRLVAFLRWCGEIATRLQNSTVALVSSAVSLSAEQKQRLQSILEKILGTSVLLHFTIDRTVLGGFRVLAGGKVFDNTVATKLALAHRTLVTQ